jgi:hypothetical protein
MKTKQTFTALLACISTTFGALGQSVPAGILQQPTNRIAYVRSAAAFYVSVSGSPSPSLQWQFYGTNLLNKTNGSLIVNPTAFSNAGPYSVVVSNASGTVVSQTAWLSV